MIGFPVSIHDIDHFACSPDFRYLTHYRAKGSQNNTTNSDRRAAERVVSICMGEGLARRLVVRDKFSRGYAEEVV